MQIFKSRNAIPVGMILATAIVDALWRPHTDIVWQTPLPLAVVLPIWPLSVWFFYTAVRPKPQFAEVALYACLWQLYGIFGGQLSYLGIALAHPLHDATLLRLDAGLGLDWRSWVELTNASGWFRSLLKFAYGSFMWQPLLSIGILGWYRPGRNRELLTGMIVGTTISIAIAVYLPAYGPGNASGIKGPWEWDKAIAVLRSGAPTPLPYVGVVTFPSVHAVFAVLQMTAHRGLKWTFFPVVALNGLMLASTRWYGDHYMVDVLVGALIGAFSFVLSKALHATPEFWFSPRRILTATEGRA